MTTVVVFDKNTRQVLAAIPLAEGEAAICRNDVGFQIFNGTEPVFTETLTGPILAENKFIFNPE